jgi:hypothetical protein
VAAKPEDKARWFHPHLRKGEAGDKHVDKVVAAPLAGFPPSNKSVAEEHGPGLQPIR